ncbi:MAG: ABC transporter permease [Armatimonadota bacterium]|nr:ABC transporter permease [Armatimonadota bacterium]MDR7454396.1 ABC transporter permease [Armatimonadota bacterium]MDR7495764.1 ABC transporter permease [Armatimonadota bacterium]MDR7510796.1 ABC transporter permease [Armatimonadota bacterium]
MNRRGGLWRRFLRHRSAAAGLVVIAALAVVAALAPWLAPHPPDVQNLPGRLAPPGTPGHPLGTDELGRDILSRLLYGARISLVIGIIVVAVAVGVGVPAGALAGYNPRYDGVIMRAVDLMLSFPGILLALVIIAVLGPGLGNTMLAVGIFSVPVFVRITRASILSVRELEYVQAARAAGARDGRILFRHMLPNCLAPLLVQATFRVATSILTAASLSFIGLGAQPPTPEWGAMLATGRVNLYIAPHVTLYPGLAIFITVLAFNLLGDGLRDVLDPRLRAAH